MSEFLLSRLSLIIAVTLSIVSANAQEIAFFAPLSGPNAIVGKQIRDGSNSPVIDDGCDAKTSTVVTKNALAQGTRIFIGFPCVESLDAAADIISQTTEDEIILTLGVQAQDVTNRDRRPDWPVYRLGPSYAQEGNAIADFIRGAWREKQFAIIDDGTLYGRQLAENVRLVLENDNLKPVFVDTYRPLLERQIGLVRRIAKAGATHVFVGGDAYDAAIIGVDAAGLGINLTMAGGTAFQAPPQDGKLPEGTVYAAVSDNLVLHTKTAVGSSSSHYELLARVGKQVGEQVLTASSEKQTGLNVAMRTRDFKTDVGIISFGNDGENNIDWFSIFEIRNGKPVRVPENRVSQ